MSSPERQGLPQYAAMLDAYQRSRQPELSEIIASLPLADHGRALDVACGAGAYTRQLARAAADRGVRTSVVGIDCELPYIRLAIERTACATGVGFCAGDAERLPFPDASFDLVLLVQSFFTLPDPISALCEMRRVTHPGGTVAVLEHDSLHQLVLPWPAELELAVREAQLAAWKDEYPPEHVDKFYAARHMPAYFTEAGLEGAQTRTFSVERSAPLSCDEETFLNHYASDLRQRVFPYLAAPHRDEFDALFDRRSPGYMMARPDFHLVQLEMLTTAVKAG